MRKRIARKSSRKLRRGSSESEPKSKKPVKQEVKEEQIVALINEWDALKANEKAIKKRIDELKPRIWEVAEGVGAKDSKGSFNYVHNNEKVLSKQARTTVKMDEEKALALLKKKKLLDKGTKQITVLDEDAIEQLYTQNKISAKELESIVNKKTVYACVVAKYEPPEEDDGDMPEVQVSKRARK